MSYVPLTSHVRLLSSVVTWRESGTRQTEPHSEAFLSIWPSCPLQLRRSSISSIPVFLSFLDFLSCMSTSRKSLAASASGSDCIEAPHYYPMTSNIVAFIVALLLTAAPAASQCYLPNGTDTNVAHGNNFYQSCGFKWPGAKHSMCCRLGDGGDTCLPNGLCSSGWNWRESCTDPTWEDPGCLQLFPEGEGTDPK